MISGLFYGFTCPIQMLSEKIPKNMVTFFDDCDDTHCVVSKLYTEQYKISPDLIRSLKSFGPPKYIALKDLKTNIDDLLPFPSQEEILLIEKYSKLCCMENYGWVVIFIENNTIMKEIPVYDINSLLPYKINISFNFCRRYPLIIILPITLISSFLIYRRYINK